MKNSGLHISLTRKKTVIQMLLITHNLLDTLRVFWTFHWTHVRQFTVVQNHKKPQSVPEATQNTRRILMLRITWCFVGHLSNT